MNNGNKKVHKKRIVSVICITLVTIAIILVGVLNPIYENSDTPTQNLDSQREPAKSIEKIESIRDASRNFTFDIVSSKEINNRNISEFVKVTDSHENNISVSVVKKDGFFTVNPPTELYEAGEYYQIELFNAKFKDERMADNQQIVVGITKETVEKVKYNDCVRDISGTKFIQKSDDRLELVNDLNNPYKADDIILIDEETESGSCEKVAYKIDSVLADNGNVSILEVSRPSLNEVYDELEIYGSYDPSPEDIKLYTEEEVVEQILQTETVQSIGYAVSVINGETPISPMDFSFGGSLGTSGSKFLPKSIKLSVNVKNFNPIEIGGSIKLTWKIGYPKEDLAMDLIVTIGIDVKVTNYENIDLENEIVATGRVTSTTLKIGIELVYEKEKDWNVKERESKILKQLFCAETANKVPTDALDELNKPRYKYDEKSQKYKPSNKGDYIEDGKGGYKKRYSESDYANQALGISDGFMQVESDEKNELMQTILAYAQFYKMANTNASSDLIPLAHVMVMFFPSGVTLDFKIGFVLSFSFQAAFQGEFTLKIVNETGEITIKDKTESYKNDYTSWEVDFIFTGTITFKIGVGLDFKLSFLRVVYVKIKGEAGGYITLKGMKGISFGSDKDPNLSDDGASSVINFERIDGIGKFEIGGYASATGELGVEFGVGALKFNISASVTWSENWKIFEMGTSADIYTDLIFESALRGRLEDKIENAVILNKDFSDDVDFSNEYINMTQSVNEKYTLNDNIYRLQLGRVFRRTINISKGTISYEYIPYDKLVFLNNNDVEISYNGLIYPKDIEKPEIDEIIYVMVKDNAGNIDEKVFTVFGVTKECVPVKKVDISPMATESKIYVDDDLLIGARFTPTNASYKDCNYEVVKVQHNGTMVYGDNALEYAYFASNKNKETAVLRSTAKISVGDKIWIKATAIRDEVSSEMLEIQVVRRHVDSVSLVTQNRQMTVVPGQRLPFELFVYPQNATYNTEGENPVITVNNANLASVESDGEKNTLVVVNNFENFGSTVTLTVMIDDGDQKVVSEFNFRIVYVPIDGLKICDYALQELQAYTTLNRGQSFRLVPIASPDGATVLDKISILKSVDNEYITIGEDNILRVSDYAPIGYEFDVTARYQNVNSRLYKFTIGKVSVERVNLLTHSNIYDVEPNESIMLYTEVYPSNATFVQPKFDVIKGKDYATISENGLLSIKADAPIGASIEVQAQVDGVLSNVIEFKIPIRGIKVNLEKEILKAGEIIRLSSSLTPTNNCLLPIRYELVDGDEYAQLTEDGLLTVNKDIFVDNAQISVKALCDGIESEIEIIKIKVPVDSVALTSFNDSLQLGNSMRLNVTINPTYSTEKQVEYKITSNAEYAQILNGYVTVTDHLEAIGKIIEIIATVDGVESNTLRIRVTRVYVSRVVYDESMQDENGEVNVGVAKGATKFLSAKVYPENATISQISYHISSGLAYATISENILAVLPNAPVGAKIEITATADGVNSEVPLTVEVLKVSAVDVTLTTSNDLTKVMPSDKLIFSAAVMPENTTYSHVTYKLAKAYSYAIIDSETGIVTVSDINIFDRGNVEFEVFAIADGKESNRITVSVFVPTTSIMLSANKSNPMPGESVGLNGIVNYNATDKAVEYSIVDGEQYASIDDNMIQINETVYLPNAQIKVKASAQGIDSNIVTLNIYNKVTSVILSSDTANIRLGHTAHVSATVTPAYASRPQIEYRFVDSKGNQISNPIGVTFDRTNNTISVENDKILLNQPFFYMRAYADGIESEILQFRINKNPVTTIEFNYNKLAEIYNKDMGYYEVNPKENYQSILQAKVNSDATVNNITFKVDQYDGSPVNGYDISEINDVNIYVLKGYYCANLGVSKYADISHKIVVTAQSLDNPSIRDSIEILITPIYADAIVGVKASRIGIEDESKDEFPIIEGETPEYHLEGREGCYIYPGDTILINDLYFDNEVIDKTDINVTYDYNYRILADGAEDFILKANAKSFALKNKNELLTVLNKKHDSFDITIVLSQNGREDIYFRLTFIIYVKAEEILKVEASSADGDYKEYDNTTQNQIIWHVNRNNGNDKNVFTFRFAFNGNSFVTRDLSKTDSVKIECSNKTKAAVECSVESDKAVDSYYNTITVKFMDWHAYGESFLIKIYSPDNTNDFIRKPLFTTTLKINPLIPKSAAVTFGYDSTDLDSEGKVITNSDSYQVENIKFRPSVDGKREYADLRIGYKVNLLFNGNILENYHENEGNYLGTTRVIISDENGAKINKNSKFAYINAEGFNSNYDKVSKIYTFRFKYEDGDYKYEQELNIRIVGIPKGTLLTDGSGITDIKMDLTKHWKKDENTKKVIGVSYFEEAFLEPNFKLKETGENAKFKGNGYISNGKTLVITNTDTLEDELVRVIYDYNMVYNKVKIPVNLGEETLERRFVKTRAQFRQLGFKSNISATYYLIDDIDCSQPITIKEWFSDSWDKMDQTLRDYYESMNYDKQLIYDWIGMPQLGVNLNGNFHSIKNITVDIGDNKYEVLIKRGLFERINVGVTLSNLNLKNVNMYSEVQHNGKDVYIGGLAAENYGTIVQVIVQSGNVNINRKGSVVGGIVGINCGTIKGCFNRANIRGNGDMGGIAGRNGSDDWQGLIENCYNNAEITLYYKDVKSVGGIVGENRKNSTVKNCCNSGYLKSDNKIEGEVRMGAIVGHNSGKFIYNPEDSRGGWQTVYTYYNGTPVFNWGKFDNGKYLFSVADGRVGRNDGTIEIN